MYLLPGIVWRQWARHLYIELDELTLGGGGADETNCGMVGRLASTGIWMLYA
jgi:hypothetical protein